jgi:hypothetical protein
LAGNEGGPLAPRAEESPVALAGAWDVGSAYVGFDIPHAGQNLSSGSTGVPQASHGRPDGATTSASTIGPSTNWMSGEAGNFGIQIADFRTRHK